MDTLTLIIYAIIIYLLWTILVKLGDINKILQGIKTDRLTKDSMDLKREIFETNQRKSKDIVDKHEEKISKYIKEMENLLEIPKE